MPTFEHRYDDRAIGTAIAATGDNGRVPHPEQPLTRRAARAAAQADVVAPRHARERRRLRAARWLAGIVGAALVVSGVAALATALGDRVDASAEPAHSRPVQPAAPVATALPVPAQTGTPSASCDDPAVVDALESGSDAEVVAAFGGAAAFRDAVAGGGAACVDLSDATHLWVVVNKQRPLDPVDFAPASVIPPEDMQRTADVRLRPDAAAALTDLVAAAGDEGAGAIGLNSAYRSYASQVRTYDGYVRSLGRAQADRQSARPGFSEHQTGLATDVAACSGGCAGIESFGGTRQAAWVAENAWRFGFVVRYEEGATDVTGYEWEPWHLRYLGPELAKAYHDGGFHTLEGFFGLPPAPDYAG